MDDEWRLADVGLGGAGQLRAVPLVAVPGAVNREVAAHDRRHIQLSLTEEGLRVAEQIIEVEKELYRSIDAAAEGHDLNQITRFLYALVADLPAGLALARRRTSGNT